MTCKQHAPLKVSGFQSYPKLLQKKKSHLNATFKNVLHHAEYVKTVPCLTNILEILYSIFDSIELWTVQHLGQEIHRLETHAHKHTSLKQTEVFKLAENTGIISALPCNWDCGFWLVQLDFPTGCEGSLEWGRES